MKEEELRKIQAKHLQHDMEHKDRNYRLKINTFGLAIFAAVAAGFVKVWELALTTIKVTSGQ